VAAGSASASAAVPKAADAAQGAAADEGDKAEIPHCGFIEKGIGRMILWQNNLKPRSGKIILPPNHSA